MRLNQARMAVIAAARRQPDPSPALQAALSSLDDAYAALAPASKEVAERAQQYADENDVTLGQALVREQRLTVMREVARADAAACSPDGSHIGPCGAPDCVMLGVAQDFGDDGRESASEGE